MPLSKPPGFVDWVPSNDPLKIVEPSAARKATGHVPDERPSPFQHNWIFNRFDRWQKYFESVTDELVATLAIFDAVVGTGPLATHATIQEAHDDVLTVPGSSILVLSHPTITATIAITKAQIELIFKPNVTLAKDGATPSGLSIGSSADGFRMRFGRMTGWSGVGERAIDVAVDADFVILRDIRFFNNTKDIEDNANPNLSTSGLLTE